MEIANTTAAAALVKRSRQTKIHATNGDCQQIPCATHINEIVANFSESGFVNMPAHQVFFSDLLGTEPPCIRVSVFRIQVWGILDSLSTVIVETYLLLQQPSQAPKKRPCCKDAAVLPAVITQLPK